MRSGLAIWWGAPGRGCRAGCIRHGGSLLRKGVICMIDMTSHEHKGYFHGVRPRSGRKGYMEPNNMKSRNGLLLALAALAFFSASCAVEGGSSATGLPTSNGVPAASSAPAARLGLAPALRPLYDALEGEGDWVLVEPQGWV